MPWDASPGGGFTTGEPWLPLGDHAQVNVAAESAQSDSVLALYRRLLALRRIQPALSRGALADIRSWGDVLVYERRAARTRLTVMLNLGHAACEVPAGEAQILLSTFLDRSGETVVGTLTLRAAEGVYPYRRGRDRFGGARNVLAEELLRRPGDDCTLMARAFEFDRAGLARTVATRDCRCAVRCAADDFRQRHLTLVAVGQADDDQAEVQQVGDDREERRFVAAVLGRAGGERGADFPVESPARPEAATLIEKRGHLRSHATEARSGSDHDRVVVFEVADCGDGRGLVELEVGRFGDRFGRGLRHALDVDLRSGGPGAFGDRAGHRFDMAVRRVVEDENFRHGGS
jgi:Domain of unknown function (DUF3459)